MKINAWLKEVAYLGEFDDMEGDKLPCYYSHYDNSYIVLQSLKKNIKFLADRDITGQLTDGVGFSPKTHEWFGWSRRGICGFTIGSKVKKGDCAYFAANKEDFIEQYMEFWSDDCHEDQWVSGITDKGFTISWVYDNTVPNENIRGSVNSIDIDFPKTFGRGEWKAICMYDAHQMAIDYNESVS
jgi:hypothetical protein